MASSRAAARAGRAPPALDVFISYRREDAADAAGRLGDTLSARFGEEHVFMDVDAIPLGVDFATEVTKRVESCDVLIALLGKAWLTMTDEEGRSRLDDPEDFVRIEIEAALKRDVAVIPALIQGVRMPKTAELPTPLKPFARRQGIELRHGAPWRADVDRLVQALEQIAQDKAKRRAPPRKVTRKPAARKNQPKAPRSKPAATPTPQSKQTLSGEGSEAFQWPADSLPSPVLGRNVEGELRSTGVSGVSGELAGRLEEQLAPNEQILAGCSYEQARFGAEQLPAGDVIVTDKRLLLFVRFTKRVAGVRWTALRGFVAPVYPAFPGVEWAAQTNTIRFMRGPEEEWGRIVIDDLNVASRLSDIVNAQIRTA